MSDNCIVDVHSIAPVQWSGAINFLGYLKVISIVVNNNCINCVASDKSFLRYSNWFARGGLRCYSGDVVCTASL